MTHADSGNADTHYQAFRVPSEKEVIFFPVFQHPITKDLYVIWSDITNCFPEATRIQFRNVYVPMLRDSRLHRVKPFGIKYHPGVVLDIIFGKRPTGRKYRSSREHQSINSSIDYPAAAAVAVGEVPGQSADHSAGDKNGKDDVGDRAGGEGEAEAKMTEDQEDRAVGLDSMLKGSTDQAALVSVPNISPASDREVLEKGEGAPEQEEDLTTKEQKEEQEREREEKEEQGQDVTTPYAQAMPVGNVRPDLPFTIEDLIRHRVKNIMEARYSWAQCSGHSRFFVLLPVLESNLRPPGAASTSSTATTPTTTATSSVPGIYNKTKFQLYFLCDCGGLPEAKDKANPHWIDKNGRIPTSLPAVKDLNQQQLRALIPIVGDYVMGILEMLKYGVYIERIPQDTAQRVSLAIKYLESKGVQSCESLIAEISSNPTVPATESLLDRLPPIASLVEKALDAFGSKLSRDPNGQYSVMYPLRTVRGDARWMCGRHWMSTWSDVALYTKALTFHQEPESPEGSFTPLYGILSSRITTVKRALQFFELARQLPRNPVFTVWLDWNLTVKDEEELAQAIGGLSAAVVHILVRVRSKPQDEIDAGMAFGQLRLTTAALRNSDIEMFTLTEADPEGKYNYQDLPTDMTYRQSYGPKAGTQITVVSRHERGGRMAAAVRGTDADLALSTIRRVTGGFHHFAGLRFGHNEHHLIVKFGGTKEGEIVGSDVEKDTDFANGDMMSFIEKRQWKDEVYCTSDIDFGAQFFHLGYLSKVIMRFSRDSHWAEVREVIVSNKHLNAITLDCQMPDFDPSQVFETYKDLLSDHPTIEKFQIHSGMHSAEVTSTFTWRNPNDPAKTRVDITCCRCDDVEAMFQRYAPMIERLALEGIDATDAAAMLKSMRRKKKPLALKYLSVKDIHLLEPTVREILQEVILKGAMEDVIIRGSVTAQAGRKESVSKARLMANVKIWAEFLFAVRSKVTELAVQDSPKRRLLHAMESLPAVSVEMPRLTLFHLTCATQSGLLESPWLDMFFKYKGPAAQEDKNVFKSGDVCSADALTRTSQMAERNQTITDLRLHEGVMTQEDWIRLLGYLDFSRMVNCSVQQTNVLAPATLLQIANVVLKDSAVLQYFYVRDGRGVDDDTAAVLETIFGPKKADVEGEQESSKLIDLNGFIL
ncbi:hypothetical protein KI688_006910 [Linnemannia hyalina]|uniref:Uncharacterized protein n=1 Tax=Linnemannia hyalina TaxID=64524 RepID=A0A9P7XJM0_9FUNG|nr:hypothetical protein KI688_006910 [Linnemannia hyalina]